VGFYASKSGGGLIVEIPRIGYPWWSCERWQKGLGICGCKVASVGSETWQGLEAVELLRNYFLAELREFYRRERQWLVLLPEVERRLSQGEVREAVEQHLEQTVAHVNLLEELFYLIRADDRRGALRMRPLLEEADEVLAALTQSSLPARVPLLTRRIYPGGGRN
jgi:hypothetical protein